MITKELEYNTDLFGKKYNFLYIVGISGSGKTSLAKILSKKYNATHIELDDLNFDNYTEKYLSKKYNKMTDIQWKFYDGKNDFLKYFNYIQKYINTHKNELFIIEGVQIANYTELFEYVKDKPIIIMNNNYILSTYRAIKRDFKYKYKNKDDNRSYSFIFKQIIINNFYKFNKKLEEFKYKLKKKVAN